MSRRPAPYQQGQLDSLCGIYAAINAIQLALGPRAGRFTIQDWQHLFYALVFAADETIGAVTATACGIYAKPLLTILKSAAGHMADQHEVTLTAHRVLKRKEKPALHELLARLGGLVEEPHSAVMISFDGHLDHWTVLRKVRRSTLELFDSSQFSRVMIANCRMSYEAATSMKREHIIRPRSIVRIVVT